MENPIFILFFVKIKSNNLEHKIYVQKKRAVFPTHTHIGLRFFLNFILHI